MGYNNPDRRLVRVKTTDIKRLRRLRRRAEKRLLHGEHVRKTALYATRRGWWWA